MRQRLFASGKHESKSQVRSSTRHLRFATAANEIAGAVLIGAQVRSAFQHALGGAGLLRIETVIRALRVPRDRSGARERAVVIRAVPIGAPLPDVASHVEQAKSIRRKRADWRCS